MAEQSQNPGAVTNLFNKGMVKDVNETFVGEGLWTHARNLVNNNHDGQMGIVGNEPANLHCVTLPYTMIGCIRLLDDRWAIFTTDDTNSEIGIFDESSCTYTKKVNDPCLGFKRSNLITGVSRRRYDCAVPVYWADGLNPDRFMDLENPPFKYTTRLVNGCIIKNFTTQLDCEKIRLASLLDQACLTLKKGNGAGTLANGSYQVCLAYTINQTKISDYIALSNVQSLWSHDNVNGSLEVEISSIDTSFDEFELVIISTINAQTVAKRLGFYSTAQGTVYIDSISPELVSIPLQLIGLRTEAIEKSDAMYSVNGYLLRVGSYSKYQFNYQPQANKIASRWVAVNYPSDYYTKGGSNTSYMRDEQYAFFIRWVYNTGERSASFHIPGRAASATDKDLVFGGDAYETLGPTPFNVERWQVENTGTVESLTSYTLGDGGTVVATGKMGYWESTERYPADRFDIWGNLCGKPIRHHKFPDNTVADVLNHFSNQGNTITILGVQFDNITHPLDQNGNPIDAIVGYEILRGSREGNKTIIAKGLLNNMRPYTPADNPSVKGLYANYPYNDLRSDWYHTSNKSLIEKGGDGDGNDPLPRPYKNIFSFHSPDTTFTKPFLGVSELKIYEEQHGQSTGLFEYPYQHPKFKLLGKVAGTIGTIVGALQAAGVVSNGVKVEATEDLPVGFQVGPVPTFPAVPTGANGIGAIQAAISYVVFAGQVAVWAASLAAVVTMAKALGDAMKEKVLELFLAIAKKNQFALQYNSHGFYNQSKIVPVGERRRAITDASYVSNHMQTFGTDYKVNNLYRGNYVALKVGQDIADPSVVDNSRVRIKGDGIDTSVAVPFTRTISSKYGALKVSFENQYGQLESIKQIPISPCMFVTVPDKIKTFTTSTILFGGDTYINRFTEKNSMFFFSDWLVGQPDLTEFEYRNYINIPYPRYWVSSDKVTAGLLDSLSSFRRLQDISYNTTGLWLDRGYFYISANGVRDFFVESEVNVAYRDYEEELSKRHYDPYAFQDYQSIFRSDIIKSGNYYKYDYSLSVSRLFNNYASWGTIYPRDYDPATASTCYVYRPKRVLYSLPQEQELKKDNWRVFLANNYKDFVSQVTVVKPINKTGAIFLMDNQSPISFTGVDQLQTDIGTKITIGDGGLFQQPLQSLVNSDESYEYGSCQNRFAVLGTTHGVFWVSQNQGKIFQYAGGLNEISREGMKWWFAKYLPSELLKVYPGYPLYDNPVKGVGVQMIYDNTNEIVYVTKKDYKPKRSDMLYDEGGFYYITGYTTTTTCAPGYTLQGNVCVRDTPGCPAGYTFQNGTCVRVETVSAIQTGSVVEVTRTPYEVYGNYGVKVYDGPSLGSSYTILNTANPFWVRAANPGNWNSLTAAQKQAYDLNNGPVNRLSIWGEQLDSSGNSYNNYNLPPNSGSLPPVGQWIGFDVCINIQETKTYHVCIAADNRYRILVDGALVLQDQTGTTNTFNFLHIFPVTLTAGNHILRVEGYNSGQLAGFGCEIFDLNNRPSGTTVVDYLNQQTNYSNLDPVTVFTTRNASQFSSNLYSCPVGYGLTNPSCNEPVCSRTITAPPIPVTAPPIIIREPIKVYCNWWDANGSECWEDASWTISYDPKNKLWLSFHDWKPSFVIPGKAHFMSVNQDSIWKHNQRCDLFCNFYGKDYPFEIEFVTPTGQTVNSVRSFEYLLEAYRYYNNCADKFHILDQNVDQAMVYNSEQVSGLLELYLKDKSNPLDMLAYPQVGTNSIKINFSKEEQKYRFNQFWDITKDRGEFSGASTPMFITKPNGYEFEINPAYVDYNKSPLQRKKFRHNVNRVWLRKMKSNDVKLMLKLTNQKTLQSPR